MNLLQHRTLTRGIALPVGVALVMGVGAAGAHAVPVDPGVPEVVAVAPAPPGGALPPLPGVAVPGPADPRVAAALSRVHQLPSDAGPGEIAAAMFPDDEALRAEALVRLEHVQRALRTASADASLKEDPRTEAVPAFVLAAIPFIAKCVVGALGGAGVEVVKNLVTDGKWPEAEDMILEAVLGCLTPFVPWGPLKRRIGTEIAGLVLWFIVHFT